MCGGQSGNQTDTSLSSSFYPVAVLPMATVDIHHSQSCTEAVHSKRRGLPYNKNINKVMYCHPSQKNVSDTSYRLQDRALCVQYWSSGEISLKAVLYI